MASIFDFIAYLPVLNTVNRWLGALLGMIENYLIMFILLYVRLITNRCHTKFNVEVIVKWSDVGAYTDYYKDVPKLVVYLYAIVTVHFSLS